MLLPPLLYGGDEREVLAFYAAVGGRHRPADHGLQQPGRQRRDRPAARLPDPARGARSTRVVAVKECSGDARRIARARAPTSDLEVLVGGDDWALEGFAAGATGWISGVANVAPEECVALQRHVDGRRARRRARDQRAHAPARPARHDAEARPVLQGRAGRGRARRRRRAGRRGWSSRPRSGRSSTRRSARCAARRSPLEGGARLRRRRLAHGGHADPRRSPAASARSRARRCSSASCTSRPSWTTCGGC